MTLVIPSTLDAAREAETRLLQEVEGHGYGEAAVFAIKLAVEEAINNAIKHGNHFDPHKTVDITFDVGPEQVVVAITDQGEGFTLNQLPDPTADENLEKPTGRGVMLMQAYMDEVSFSQKGNQVRMVKKKA